MEGGGNYNNRIFLAVYRIEPLGSALYYYWEGVGERKIKIETKCLRPYDNRSCIFATRVPPPFRSRIPNYRRKTKRIRI